MCEYDLLAGGFQGYREAGPVRVGARLRLHGIDHGRPQKLVDRQLRPHLLFQADAVLQSGSLITDTLLGTPLGALLFGVCATLPFAADAVSFAAAAVLALTLSGDFRPRPQTTPNPWRTLLDDTTQGVRWLWQHPLLRRLCLMSGITNFVGGGLIAILVLYARQTLGLNSLGFALLVASFAVGGVAGAMATPRLSARYGTPRVLRLAAAAPAGTAVAADAASSGLIAGACIAAYGAANLAWNVTAVSLRQALVPAHLTGARRHGLPGGHRRGNHARRCSRGP
ncbi:MFS transporter [Streptomyces sp. NPDC048106]|uniref:MFS transporter n=1 Tax=Streptomyces sp. NPDC048106 TaxID=3155750 RepID=UPI0034553970